jgi:hypothetical protein
MLRLTASFFTLTFLIQSTTPVFAISFRTVALTGTTAPDGEIFSRLGTPTINAGGEIAFTGAVKSNTGEVYGIWSEASGSLRSVVKVLDPAPGTGGLHGGLYSAVITNNDQTLFMSSIAGVASHINTLWYAKNGVATLSAPSQAGAPGVPGAQLESMQDPAFNLEGYVAFESYLSGSGIDYLNNSGIWAGLVESPKLAVRTGDDVAGVDGSKFQLLSRPVLNNVGHFVFEASFGPSDTAACSGIFLKRNGPAELIISTHTEAPGTQGAVFTSRVGRKLDLNDYGDVAFSGYLDGTGVIDQNRDGIWLYNQGTISLIVRSGDTAPNTDGAVFGQHDSTIVFGPPKLNNAGQVLFSARLNGVEVNHWNSDSIWLQEKGDLSLIVRAGQSAPGTSGRNFWGFGRPWINETGQILFGATLTPQSNEYFGRNGVWLTDIYGSLKLIVQEGSLFDVNDDPNIIDLRTVESIRYTIDERTGTSSFNASGQLAFHVVFTDGTEGLFVANTIIPEPSSITLTVSILCIVGYQIRVRRYASLN